MGKIFKIKLIIITIAILIFFLFDNGIATTIPAESCSYDHVKAAYDAAGEGDTILVPAGSAVWTSTLTITKGIKLVGATTCISSGTAGTGGYSISFDDATSITAGGGVTKLIEIKLSKSSNLDISGFTFIGQAASVDAAYLVYFSDTGTSTPYETFRVHHNKFSTARKGVEISLGLVWGLIDNNYFYNLLAAVSVTGINQKIYPMYKGEQDCSDSENPRYLLWDDLNMGGEDFLFIEDNYSVENKGTFVFKLGQGTRTVIRYNTVQTTDDWNDCRAYVDFHYTEYGVIAGEISNNTFVNNDPDTTSIPFWPAQVRGGANVMYNNSTLQPEGKMNCRYLMKTHEENLEGCDAILDITSGGYFYNGLKDTYVWNNTYNGSRAFFEVGDTKNCIDSGVEYWSDTKDDGQDAQDAYAFISGETAPESCTIGDVFWDTDDEHGEGHSTGSLYKCTSTDTWTWIYSPYTYPHPLRRPKPPSGFKIVQ